MFTVGDEVKVVGELDVAREFLQDVDAETFATQFAVGLCLANNPVRKRHAFNHFNQLNDGANNCCMVLYV